MKGLFFQGCFYGEKGRGMEWAGCQNSCAGVDLWHLFAFEEVLCGSSKLSPRLCLRLPLVCSMHKTLLRAADSVISQELCRWWKLLAVTLVHVDSKPPWQRFPESA